MNDGGRCRLCGSLATTRLFSEVVRGEHFNLVSCDRCRLVQTQPQPSEAFLHRLYSEDYASAVSGAYCSEAALSRADHERVMDRLVRAAPGSPARLLDVGCGVGNFLEVVEARGWEAHGIEFSTHAAERARARFGERIRLGELSAADYEPASFDAASLWYVLEHVRDPVSVLDGVRELLRPAGRLVVAVPNWDYIRVRRQLGRAKGRLGTVDPHEHLFQYTWATLERLLARTGFAIEWRGMATPYYLGSPATQAVKRVAHRAITMWARATGQRLGGILAIARVERGR